jgi:hypothetical protein
VKSVPPCISTIGDETARQTPDYDRTTDAKRAGTTAAIDVLRAHVQLEQEQQQLIAQEMSRALDSGLWLGRNRFSKD